MDRLTVSSDGPDATAAIGSVLASYLHEGDVVLLKGALATGKTTFVKAIAAALGSSQVATSPTFMLAQFYPTSSVTILHIDTYRLSGLPEYRDLGLDEFIEESITLIEWGEKIMDEFPCHLMIEFECVARSPELRQLTFSASGRRWHPVLGDLREKLLTAVTAG